MLRRYGSFLPWLLGALIIIGAFYAGTTRLWKATEESRASSLEKDVVSAAMNDIAEGNLIRFGFTLSKLQREGQIRYAEIRHVGKESDTLFRTPGVAPSSDRTLSDFGCGSMRRLFDSENGGIGLISVLPTKIAGGQCDVLLLTADMPQELRHFKNRLLSTMIFFVALVLGLFAFVSIIWHRRLLRLEVQNSIMHAERDAAIGRIAAQVAHDIRSPLAALDSVLKDLSQLPEENRAIVRSAVGRIRDIANNLLEKNRPATTSDDRPVAGDSETPRLLSSLIDPLVTEKRLQFRAQLEVEIDSRLTPSSYGLFVEIPPPTLQRVLSNLINNAVEALPGKGRVTVRLSSDEKNVEIQIKDNGKGIPPEGLARLGRRGETRGKSGGSGLGLYHAKTSVEAYGGSVAVDSAPGQGTTVILRLPRAKAPRWFVPELIVAAGMKVVVLDDDANIHQVWRGRFESALSKNRKVEVLHFSMPAQLRSWVRAAPDDAARALYLVDYEFLGHDETGLGLVQDLGIGDRTILVTSRFEDPGVLAHAAQIKARIIPKPLSGFVPILFQDGSMTGHLDAVLIDDDPLVRMTWKMTAERVGKRFRPYSTIHAFMEEARGIARDAVIYVDADLAGDVDGAKESVRIHELGFEEIYLTTGHDPAKYLPLKHLRGVVGKGPPWVDDAEPERRPSSEKTV